MRCLFFMDGNYGGFEGKKLFKIEIIGYVFTIAFIIASIIVFAIF